MRNYLLKILFIAWKDLLSELRTKNILISVLIFALLVLVIFNFTFELQNEIRASISSSILWVAFTFAGMLGLNRSMLIEIEKDCLEGLMLCPLDRDAIYFGKVLSSFTFILSVEIIVLFIFSILFNLPILVPELMLILLLATLGFVAVGILFSAVASNTRAQEIMLPVLFLPIVVPLLLAAIKATELALLREPLATLLPHLGLIGAFDGISLTVSAFLFEYVIEK